MLTRNYKNPPNGRILALTITTEAFVRPTQGRNPTLSRDDESGQATVLRARLTRRFRAVSYELATSLGLARFMRNSAVAYTKFNICSARTRRVRLSRH